MNKAIISLILTVSCLVGGCDEPTPAVQKPQTVDFRDIVQSAKDKVFPAVVYIKSLRESHEQGKRSTEEIVGSGVIISATGEVLSNWHVVDKARNDTVQCLLYDGQHLDAKIIGTDKDTDLSLLQLQMPKNAKPLPFASLGDSSQLREGDFVMAMGAPYGLNRSVSIGIISCTSRYLSESSEYSRWLQTDAAISPGNSGGPLVDTQGRVIGINTRGGGNVGFAVPSQNVKIIVEQLREFNKVNWSWTGLQLQPLRNFLKDIYFEGDTGVIVAETDPGSPARLAGVQVHDRILKVNGKPLTALWMEDLPSVRRQLGLLKKNVPATFEVQRNGTTLTLQITPREKGKVEGEELDCPRWDLTVKAINQFDNKDLYFYCKKGVFVFGVKHPGNASEAGLQKDDIITKIGSTPIETLDDVRKVHAEALKNVASNHRIMFIVLRNGLMRQLVVDFARDYEKE